MKNRPVMIREGGKFSDCGKYRYMLYRIWDESKPHVQLIGLNPSTANATKDDSTIENIIRIMMANDYGGFYMTNLFALISPEPKDLRSCADPVMDNDYHLSVVRGMAQDVVFCWGNFPMAAYRAKVIKEAFGPAKCFAKNKDGSPRHPLYLKSDTKLMAY